MTYRNLLDRVYNRPHLIMLDKLESIRAVVTNRAVGLEAPGIVHVAMEDAAARRKPSMSRSVAVLPVVGTLAKRMDMVGESSGGMSTDRIGMEFDRLLNDDAVAAIVLDIDSPGGESFGVQELSDKIYAARGRKPITAVANPEAASAAYYIGSAADELSVTPSGWVGSIGAVMVHTDLSRLNETLGRTVTYIHAGQFKVEGNADEPLSDESLAYFQREVDAVAEQFVRDVARNRGVSAADVRRAYGEGRMLRARDAKAAGMVDRIETLDEAIARLATGGKSRRSTKLARLRLTDGL